MSKFTEVCIRLLGELFGAVLSARLYVFFFFFFGFTSVNKTAYRNGREFETCDTVKIPINLICILFDADATGQALNRDHRPLQ